MDPPFYISSQTVSNQRIIYQSLLLSHTLLEMSRGFKNEFKLIFLAIDRQNLKKSLKKAKITPKAQDKQ
jgi:hypothetical protein